MDVDELYSLAFEDFVAARDALAKERRAAKDREGADAIKALPKPTRAAAALNALVRAHPDAVEVLATAAAAVAAAQQAALGGDRDAGLPARTREAREAVDALLDELPVDVTATVREAVARTLHAAVVDPDVLAEVRGGRLARERVAAGFGGLGSALPEPAKRTSKRERAEPAARAKPRKASTGSATAKPRKRAERAPTKSGTPDADRDREAAERNADGDREAQREGERHRKAAERDAERERKTAERDAERARKAAERREAAERKAAERELRDADAALQAAEDEVTAAEAGVAEATELLADRRAGLRDAKQARIAARRRREQAARALPG